ncbi:hypothetical protein FACS1894190_04260 [Spirochaetia bacterium]|nr:hypothetical protein FACS1894190_04260 [Spirochaetia bacterium]
MKEIPCNNQINRLIDGVKPEEFDENFKDGIGLAEKYGVFEQYKVLDGGVLIALDGVWFQSSEKVFCDHCLHITKDGKTTCYHSMTAAVLVRPGGEVVLPLAQEMIRNEDTRGTDKNDDAEPVQKTYGKQKQDCERTAAKRLPEKHGAYYKELKATLLGDDLYANHNTCKAVLDSGLSFIFTCKDDSHPWIAEQFKYSTPETLTRVVWTGKNHREYRYTWVNGLENRADGEKLPVQYLHFEIYVRETGKIVYKNSWITDKTITKDNVGLPVDCGRARWKIENGNNNVLKNYGYHLEHNFGHGENHACEIYCVLNLPAFFIHGLMILCDENFIKARSCFGRRDEFYNALRTFFRAHLFQSWEDFLSFVIIHAKGG